MQTSILQASIEIGLLIEVNVKWVF